MSTDNPYEALEPQRATPEPPAEARTVTVLLRGLRKRCPRCARPGIFITWFRLRDRCPRCKLKFEAEQGGFLGAMTINYGAAMALWIALLVVWLAIDLPDVHVVRLVLAGAAVVIVVPLLFYPNSKSLWAAIEYLVLRSDPDYVEPRLDEPAGPWDRRDLL